MRILFLSVLTFFSAAVFAQETKLWYKKPASNWNEALPVGNGRLGAMVFGDPQNETIQINEESLWGGRALNDNNPHSRLYLDSVRKLLLERRNDEAYSLATKYMVSIPRTVRSYQNFMNLRIQYEKGEITGYKRELNLIDGIAKSTFTLNGNTISQEVFSSAVDNILVIRITTNNASSLVCNISLDRKKDATVSVKQNMIVLSGQIRDTTTPRQGPGGLNMKFQGAALIKHTNGKLTATESGISVTGASEILMYVNAATNYNLRKMDLDEAIDQSHACMKPLTKNLSYSDVRKRHAYEHTSKMSRMAIDLGDQNLDSLPTDERLNSVKNGKTDHGLLELYFQYGRYLLLGSSRAPGVLPANLQGIWCKDYDAPWQSDFHTNINLQMNYWPAEVTNISETAWPLIDFMIRIQKNGERTAKEMYDAGGWTMHHTTSPFGQTALHDAVEYGTYPLAGAWMSLHLWEHYLYNQDVKYLREKAFPLMEGAAEFILDFLFTDNNGMLVTAPSYSPENSFVHPVTGKPTQITHAATMDIQIISELFHACITAEQILNRKQGFSNRLKETLAKLPPVRINNYGGIQEWIEDYKEAEPGHRHISHLFGLHPGTQINENTPELFAAARKTIEHRLQNGGGHTGWSRAWIINFFARLKDGDKAKEHLQALLAKSTLPNLFDDHPPFQIDGNFGGTAGIAEMLMQSHNGYIEILPALPKSWKNGSIKGLKARGGFEVDITWANGVLQSAGIKSLAGKSLEVVYKGKKEKYKLRKGERFEFGGVKN